MAKRPQIRITLTRLRPSSLAAPRNDDHGGDYGRHCDLVETKSDHAARPFRANKADGRVIKVAMSRTKVINPPIRAHK